MRTTFRQLKIFESVSRHLNFSRAAEELHLSQPAVSMQVKQLEDSAGIPLLDKVGKRLQLTDAGREMAHYCKSINQQLSELDDLMADMRGVQVGHLRLSVATTANSFATRLLTAFTQQFPGVTFSLDITNRKTLLHQLSHSETDLVIMGQPPSGLGISSRSFMGNPLVMIAPPNHPLAKRQNAIPLQSLLDENFVVREQESGTRIAMERCFAETKFHFNTSLETTSNSTIKYAVTAGLGLGVVSFHTLELELETNRLVILNTEGFPIMRHWHIAHNERRRLPPAAKAFINFLDSEAAAPLLEFNYPFPPKQ